MKVKVYAFTNSTVTITKNGAAVADGVQAITAESGHVFTISSNGSYEINSTGFIMVYGYAKQGGSTRAISSTGTRNTYQDNAMRIRSNHPI